MNDSFFITNYTKGTLPRVPFAVIKNKVLGRKFELSLVFVGERRMRTLSREYRNKDKATDILSFPLDASSGEIFICPNIAKRRAKAYNVTGVEFISRLFIHGMLHLLGFDHGGTMDSKERRLCRFFNIPSPQD